MLIRALSLLALFACCLPAQYFPLGVGNQWVYRLDEGPVKDVRIASITAVETIGGAEYFRYNGLFGETALLRLTSDNRLVARQRDGSEALWAAFETQAGESYPAALDECTGRARVESRNEQVDLLNFRWQGGFRVAYAPTNCADAGITGDLFLPGLGLAERTYSSISGPRRYRVTYARIGNATIFTGSEVSFRLSLDQAVYSQQAVLGLRLTLDNSTGKPIVLTFPSAQDYDFTIRDAQGEEVYTWSADKHFAALYREIPFQGETNWTESQGLRLKPGAYTITAWLTTQEARQYVAQVPFTVR